MRINGRTQRRGTGAKDTRRDEGVARNAAWAALSNPAKIAALHGRRGESNRQRAKLFDKLGAAQ